jgi:hypothetical protein
MIINLVFFNEIATHLSGARNDRMGKGSHSLNRNLSDRKVMTKLNRTVKLKKDL